MHRLYKDKPKDFYAKEIEAQGLKGTWNWHEKRHNIISQMVEKYSSGGVILDIGCGNCLWKKDDTPTVGLDICEPMLVYNKKRLERFYPLKADLLKSLPLKDNSIDVVVVTEVLEHLKNYSFIINQMESMLKPGGFVIGSVPYGRFPGLWNLLFVPWCLGKGLFLQDNYYLNLCGHKVNFDKRKLRLSFKRFKLVRMQVLSLLTIFFVFKKIG